MKKVILVLLFLTEIGIARPLEKTSTTKKHTKELQKFIGLPIQKFIGYDGNGTTMIWGEGKWGLHYEFKNNESCDFIFYYHNTINAPSIVADVSVSSEDCFGQHEFK